MKFLAKALKRLNEAGRTISQANETKIRAAVTALDEVLSSLDSTDTATQEAAVTKLRATLQEAAELSYSDRMCALNLALRTLLGHYVWTQDVYDTWLVYEDDGGDYSGPDRLYKRSYIIDDNGVVTFGDASEVRVETNYIPVTTTTSEAAQPVAGEFIPLIERAVRDDGTVPIKIIAPGWGSSCYYPASVLESDGPKAFPVGTKMFWNHPTATDEVERPERDLNDLAAVTVSTPVYEANGIDGPGLYANSKVFSDYQPRVDELAAHIGTSIHAFGEAKQGEAEGRKGPILQSFAVDPFNTIDFVTEPGAGGAILSLFESARRKPIVTAAPAATTTLPVVETLTNPTPQEVHPVNENEATELKEANTRLQTQADTQATTIARLQESLILRDAHDVVHEVLSEDAYSALPAMTRKRLSESLVKNPPAQDGQLDRAAFQTAVAEAAKSELEYLAQIGVPTVAGTVHGMGSNGSEKLTESKQLDEAEIEQELEKSFLGIGLSEAGAKHAAKGR